MRSSVTDARSPGDTAGITGLTVGAGREQDHLVVQLAESAAHAYIRLWPVVLWEGD